MVSNGLCLELGVWYIGEEGLVLGMSFLLFLASLIENITTFNFKVFTSSR